MIEPKYKMGETVYSYSINMNKSTNVECEECGGEGHCTITTKTTSFLAECLVCSSAYSPGRGCGYIVRYEPTVETIQLTIGEIRCLERVGEEGSVEYMCKETGIGSGTLHREHTLFKSKQEAERAGNEIMAKRIREREKQDEAQKKSKHYKMDMKDLEIIKLKQKIERLEGKLKKSSKLTDYIWTNE